MKHDQQCAIDSVVSEATTLREKGDLYSAISKLDATLAQVSSQGGDRNAEALLCSELAQCHLDVGNSAAASPLFSRALELRDDPEQLETKSDDASEDDWETGGVGMDALHKAVTNNSHEAGARSVRDSAPPRVVRGRGALHRTGADPAANYRVRAHSSNSQQGTPRTGHAHVLELVGVLPDESDITLEKFLHDLSISDLVALRRLSPESTLAAFPDADAAARALQVQPPGRLRLVALRADSPAALMASHTDLAPAAARPPSSAVVARRLIASGLNAPGLTKMKGAAAEEAQLKADRKASMASRKAERERARAMQDATWDD